ncbi:MAG: Gfo/Idh/MocA family oxidoreductase [Candidatus Anammoximicrobium sp.]|nr:Gfo/Idh/MocA family oxidoreductase [Candidatus Anammoximicrobium sp.]
MSEPTSRRSFLKTSGFGAAALSWAAAARAAEPAIQGFEKDQAGPAPAGSWKPVSDRKIRMGIVGFGVCRFGPQFSLQHHPNVQVVAVSDLFPDRCQALAQACQCKKTYPSLEEMVKDDSIEAIFVATDAPSHCRHCIEVLQHGKHVATAVPAVWENLEDADRLFETVKKTGLNYMMFETSYFHADLYAMRQIYAAGGFGKLVYSEGEYFHYACAVIPSYKDWRIGLPPQWYPTHSNAYYVGVAGGSFTEVSCLGMPSIRDELQPQNNRYKNPFGTEIALFRTSEGGMSRMAVSWDTAGHGGEVGRVRGQKGSMVGMAYQGLEKTLPDLARPALPPGVEPGGHGGSHGYLGHEFVMSILENRQPLVNVAAALNMTVAGIVAHQSALKDGERMKIPQYKL